MLIDFVLITKIAVFLINAVGFWLIFIVYFANTTKKIKRAFISTTLCMLIWVNFAYIARLPSQIDLAIFWIKIAWAVTIPLFASLYFFATSFIEKRKKVKILDLIVLIIGLCSFFVTLLTDWVIRDILSKQVWTKLIYGHGITVFYAFVLFLSFLTLSLLFKKYLTSSKREKLRTQYLLIGIVFFLFMNVIFNIIYPFFLGISNYYQLGDYSTIISMSFIAYAVTKHKLMGVKTLITQTLIIIISIILLIDLLALTDDLTMQLLKAGILTAFLYFSRGMVESVKKEKKAREELENTYKKVDKYVAELEEKNEDLGALLNASDVTAGSLNSEKIAQDIVDSVPTNLKHLGYKGAILMLYDREKKTVHTCAITESSTVKKAKKLLGKSFKEYSEPINNNNFVTKTIKTKKTQIGNKLEDFIAPTVSVKACKMVQKLVKAKSFVSLPIFSSRKIVGAMIFVGTKPKRKITQRDKDILFGFSSHIGASIENAELYEKTDVQMKELEKLNNSLEKANQKLEGLVEMKNEFLHITSHQLRTPLTAIRGMISMWYEGSFDRLSKKKRREILKNICVSAERLNNITNDMLNSIELEGGVFDFQFKQVSLEKIIKESINILKFNYDKKELYLNFDTKSGKISTIEAEPSYVRQIFLNLIDNACKYTNKGGVDIDVKKSGKYAEIIIKDTGIGVSKSDQKKIFQKFMRSKEAMIENAAGSGLGLFIVEKIIKAHYGKIEFYSKGKGKGSTVKVYLPIRQE